MAARTRDKGQKINRFVSRSPRETKRYALLLAEYLISRSVSRGSACVVALQGELGAGKTVFAQGFSRGLGVRRKIVSPTFVFVRRYPITAGSFRSFFHIDLYRLKNEGDLAALDFVSVLSDPRALVLVEWPERVRGSLPRDAIWAKIEYGEGERTRIIRISGKRLITS